MVSKIPNFQILKFYTVIVAKNTFGLYKQQSETCSIMVWTCNAACLAVYTIEIMVPIDIIFEFSIHLFIICIKYIFSRKKKQLTTSHMPSHTTKTLSHTHTITCNITHNITTWHHTHHQPHNHAFEQLLSFSACYIFLQFLYIYCVLWVNQSISF